MDKENEEMLAALYWLLVHAEQGAIRENMTEGTRKLAVDFVLAAIGETPKEKDPVKLAAITHGKVEGAYISG